MTFEPNRRTALAGAAAVAAAPLLPSASVAQQAGGLSENAPFHRFKVGDADVIALFEGANVRDMPPNFLRNADIKLYGEAQAALGLPADKLFSSYTTLLIRSGGRTILIDTGFADNGPPGTGRTAAAMKAAGVEPGSVTHVVLSHFHGDHINGLRRKDGTLSFPNAEIAVPAPEWAHWMDDAKMNAAPEAARGGFMGVRRAIGADASRVRQFEWEKEVVPGLTAVRADGHTPGHTAFLLASGKEQFLILADTTANPHIFVRQPDWHAMFDFDGPAAAATRKRMLDRAAADKVRVFFYHGAFPSTGHILKNGAAYEFAPAFPT